MKRGVIFLNKGGQVWVETVIYILIALVMIGLVLSFALPKIREVQDSAIIEQSISMLEDINVIILSLARGGPGNKRLIEVGIRKGSLIIDSENDRLVFEIESEAVYSEIGRNITHGEITILTEKRGNYNLVTLTRRYGERYDLTYTGKEELKTLSKSSTPYRLFISNKGDSEKGKTVIDFEVN